MFDIEDKGLKITLDRSIFVHEEDRKPFWELELELLSDDVREGFDEIGLGAFLERRRISSLFTRAS